MLNILIADDHAVVRYGLRQILEDGGFNIVWEASNGRQVVDWLSVHDCDVLLLDIAMPDKSGVEVLREVKEIKPNLPVLILSIYQEDQYAVCMFKAGAMGYLTKESAPTELIAAIRCVASGKQYISQAVANLLDSRSSERHHLLSEREYQVFLLLAQAQSVGEAGQRLGISVNTVSTYRKRIFEKLDVNNNAELMRYALNKGLI